MGDLCCSVLVPCSTPFFITLSCIACNHVWPFLKKSTFYIFCPQMLLNLHKKSWMDGLQLEDYKHQDKDNVEKIKVSERNSFCAFKLRVFI